MSRALPRFAWAVLALNLAVVGWGAFVRATGSGAGCGRHWPTCNGEVVPRAPGVATAIEFTHRATSGLALLLVVALVALAARTLPAGHRARRAAWVALGFMVLEALVGAGLVLFGWVARDASGARGWVMAIHLANTFLLLASLALAASWSTGPAASPPAARRPGAALAALAALMVAGATGAVAALGDTLFPATSLAEGLRAELSSGAHVLLRLRVLHPFAALVAAGLALAAARAAHRAAPDERVRRLAALVSALVAVEVVAGALNVLWLAPIPLQIGHLLVADLLWLGLVLLWDGGTPASPAPGAPPAPSVRP